jgi:hypothetical protein
MENKYYIPDISEFHVGFEFEYKHPLRDWENKIFNTNFYLESNYFIKTQTRVKYLDKEDIESLGFKCIIEEDSLYCIKESYNNSKLILEYNKWNTYISEESKTIEHNMIKIYRTDGIPIKANNKYKNISSDLFIGTIKNKSELKILLKQLGI